MLSGHAATISPAAARRRTHSDPPQSVISLRENPAAITVSNASICADEPSAVLERQDGRLRGVSIPAPSPISGPRGGRPGPWPWARPNTADPPKWTQGRCAIPIQPVGKASDGHGVALGAGSRHGAPSLAMATWGLVLATGFVTIMAAMLPTLVESKADKARRAEERAERRRDEKKAAFAAYLVAANELTGSSFDQGSGGERTARGHAAVQGLVTAAMAAELVSVGPELRRELGATFGLLGAPFGDTPGFGEHLQTIRALMTAELAEDQRIVKEHAGRHAARTGFLDRRTRRTDPSALRAHNQALPW
jgi:hypothetical protein